MSVKKKPLKRLIGYARVSTRQQDFTRQVKALKRAGCAVIYSDTASGKSMAGRPELARALDDLDTGDELQPFLGAVDVFDPKEETCPNVQSCSPMAVRFR